MPSPCLTWYPPLFPGFQRSRAATRPAEVRPRDWLVACGLTTAMRVVDRQEANDTDTFGVLHFKIRGGGMPSASYIIYYPSDFKYPLVL